MDYKFNKCFWDELTNHPILANDGKSSCNLYIYKDDPTVAYLGDLYVDESIRNNGRGKELLNYAQTLAQKCGCNKIILKVEYGSWMLKWYEREGFEPYQYDNEEPDKYVWYEKRIKLYS